MRHSGRGLAFGEFLAIEVDGISRMSLQDGNCFVELVSESRCHRPHASRVEQNPPAHSDPDAEIQTRKITCPNFRASCAISRFYYLLRGASGAAGDKSVYRSRERDLGADLADRPGQGLSNGKARSPKHAEIHDKNSGINRVKACLRTNRRVVIDGWNAVVKRIEEMHL